MSSLTLPTLDAMPNAAATEIFVRRTYLPVTAEEAYAWHLRPGAFGRLSPPWESVRLITPPQPLVEGSVAEIDVPLGPVRKRWIARHDSFVEGRQFRDVQESGPFARWEHTHRMEPQGEGCELEDRIEYALPLGVPGRLAGGGFVRAKLERMFRYRHDVTYHDLRLHRQFQGAPAMNVLVSGSTGLVGTALIPLLTTGGHEVVRLVRSKARSPSKEMVHWDPDQGTIDIAGLEGVDAVVHLAGEPIAKHRWNDKVKQRIRDSRGKSTRLLCEALAKLERKPKVLVSASATGFYGDRGDDLLTEDSPPGDSFLPEVCREWEAACEPARAAGIRVVNLRTGLVLAGNGGALASMLTPFKLGAGGIIGSGKQWWSWITLDDLLGAIVHALQTDSVYGPVNGVSPNPVTNREFTKTLGKVLNRPTIVPMPAFAARLALGGMVDELILASSRVTPTRLLSTGYQFRHPDLEAGLRHVLGK